MRVEVENGRVAVESPRSGTKSVTAGLTYSIEQGSNTPKSLSSDLKENSQTNISDPQATSDERDLNDSYSGESASVNQIVTTAGSASKKSTTSIVVIFKD